MSKLVIGGETEPAVEQTPARMKPLAKGVKCTALDSKGNSFEGVVASVSETAITVKIGEKEYPFPVVNVTSLEPLEVEPDVEIDIVPEVVEPEVVEPEVVVEDKAKEPDGPAVHAVADTSGATEVITATKLMPGLGQMAGEVKAEHLIYPKLNVVQSVGPLSEDHKAGTLLYRQDVRLLLPKEDKEGSAKRSDGSLGITCLNTRLQYREATDYDSDDMGEVVHTLAEVHAAGGTIEWDGDTQPTWNEEAHCLFLVKAPTSEIAADFQYTYKDESYAHGLIVFKKTSFGAYKEIFTQASYLKEGEGLHHLNWEMSLSRQKRGEYLVWVPILKKAGKHDPEMIAFIASTLGA